MASTNVALNDKAYKLLKKFKRPEKSFSDVIIEHFSARRLPAETAGDILDRLESMPPPPVDLEVMELYMKQRGRRSNRPKSHS